jgi:hypothetical protein
MTKRRLSASVDAALVAAGEAAVARGDAPNLSAWVSAALERQIEHDTRLRALDDFLRAYEAEHGKITDEEIEAARRDAKARAIVVRGDPKKKRARRRGAA